MSSFDSQPTHPIPRRRTIVLASGPRPLTSYTNPTSDISQPPFLRASYCGTSTQSDSDWQKWQPDMEQRFENRMERAFTDPFSDAASESTPVSSQHRRRPSSFAGSIKNGISGFRSLGRRMSSSFKGKNKNTQEESHGSPSTQVSPHGQFGQSLESSELATTRPKSRGFLHGLGYRRRPSMPLMPLLGADSEQPATKPAAHGPRPMYHRAVTVLPDYMFGGAEARASAAAQNEAFYAARFTPLPPYEAATNPRTEIRDSESGIGIVLDGTERQDSVGAHLTRCDPADVLATELVEQILCFLDANALAQLERVSRKWNGLCQSQVVWKKVFYQAYARGLAGIPTRGHGATGLGKNLPGQDFRQLYMVRRLIEKRWDKGQAAAIYLNGHKDSVYCVQFDEDKIVTGSRDNTVRVWDARTYRCVRKLAPPNNPRERTHVVRPEVEPQGIIPLFKSDASSTEPPATNLSMWHQASVLCLKYDRDILVTGSSDFTSIVWSIKDDYKPLFRLVGHTAGVLDVSIDATRIITCSKDTSIKIWDRQSGRLLKTLMGHRGPVNAVQVRGNLLASASGDGMSKLWRLDDGVCIKEFHSKERGLACVEFSEDGRTIYAGGNDHVVYEYDTTTGNIKRELQGHKDLVRSLHLDSTNGRIISGSYDHSIKIWDGQKGQSDADGGLKFSLDNWSSSWMLAAKSNYRKIACASQDGRVVIVDFGYGIAGVEKVEA